jgi:hypothetical protein
VIQRAKVEINSAKKHVIAISKKETFIVILKRILLAFKERERKGGD